MIGRFISADTIIPNPANPQSFNRYSYCLNNPLKYIDPSGHKVTIGGWDVRLIDILKRLPFAEWLVIDIISSPEYQAYDAIRSADRSITDKLEYDDDIFLEISGEDLGEHGDMATTGWYKENKNVFIKINTNKDIGLTFHQHIANMAEYLSYIYLTGWYNGKKSNS